MELTAISQPCSSDPRPAAGLTCDPFANTRECRTMVLHEDDERLLHRVMHPHLKRILSFWTGLHPFNRVFTCNVQ